MKMLRLLFLLLLIFFVFPTCGKDETQTGSATFQLFWPGDYLTKADLKPPSQAVFVKQSPTIEDVVTGRVSGREGGITGADLISPVDFLYSDHQGTVHNIPAGTDRAFVVNGLDSSKMVIFKGSVTGVTIKAGKTTDVGEIIMESCDADGDDYFDTACGGDDCDDGDDSIYPDAPELCDGIDNQCPGDVGYGTDDEGCMAQIPAGCFDMGDSSDSCSYDADECPVHNVCISGFKMDVHEVTNAEYKACVDAGVCSPPSDSGSHTRTSYYGNPTYDDYPVIYVDWNDATTYCAWLDKRLPTEAEREYAARGGLSGKRYPWGDSITCADACYGRLDPSGDCWDYGGLDNDTHPVESYAPNGYGLYDMAGNVYAWINDWYSDSYYQYCVDNTIINDPPGPDTGTSRVLRGGSWRAVRVRTSARGDFDPTTRLNRIGIRCASSGD